MTGEVERELEAWYGGMQTRVILRFACMVAKRWQTLGTSCSRYANAHCRARCLGRVAREDGIRLQLLVLQSSTSGNKTHPKLFIGRCKSFNITEPSA